MRRRFDPHKCQDVKPWVIAAITDESRYPPDRLWKKEPTAEFAYHERLKRIKFLRKHSKTDSKAMVVANRLESCEPGQRDKDACLERALSAEDYFSVGLFVVPRNSSPNKFLAPNMSSLPSALSRLIFLYDLNICLH
jgi:hypothetical protein